MRSPYYEPLLLIGAPYPHFDLKKRGLQCEEVIIDPDEFCTPWYLELNLERPISHWVSTLCTVAH